MVGRAGFRFSSVATSEMPQSPVKRVEVIIHISILLFANIITEDISYFCTIFRHVSEKCIQVHFKRSAILTGYELLK